VRRSRGPPRIRPGDDGRGRSARAILAPARRLPRGPTAATDNDPVPESTAAPPLTERFARALTFAWQVHGRQVRKKTGVPYMAHVLAVCALALEHGADEDVAIAALLHDAVEDSEDGAATRDRIEEQFGHRVARIVMDCSDAVAVPGQPKPDWRQRKETYLRHLADADEDALLVSACDKVHNAGSIVADLRAEGDAVWQRFTVKDPRLQLWYYASVKEILMRRLPGPLTAKLGRIVDELSALAGSQKARLQPRSGSGSAENPPAPGARGDTYDPRR
jgi:HD domain